MKLIFGSLLMILALTGTAFAAWPKPEDTTHRVYDYVGVFNNDQKQALDNELLGVKSPKIVVVVVPNMDGQTVEEYSQDLFHTWAIGTAEKNDGVLILLARSERKYRIQTGYGMEATLTDLACGRIIRDVMAPFSKGGKDDFASGIKAGAEAVIATVTSPNAQSTSSARPRNMKFVPDEPSMSDGAKVVLWIFVIILVIVFLAWLLSRSNRSSGYYRSSYGGRYGSSSSSSSSSSWYDSGSSSSGGGDSFSGGGDSGGGGASGDA